MWYVDYCHGGVWYRTPDPLTHEGAMRALRARVVDFNGAQIPVRAAFVCQE